MPTTHSVVTAIKSTQTWHFLFWKTVAAIQTNGKLMFHPKQMTIAPIFRRKTQHTIHDTHPILHCITTLYNTYLIHFKTHDQQFILLCVHIFFNTLSKIVA